MVTEPGRPPRLALIASPLLGPAAWVPAARVLEARGWAVTVPPAYDAVARPADVLAQVLRALPPDVPHVLVPHSNAGLFAAAVAAACDVRGIVFVDARLPEDDANAADGESAFRGFLAGLADAEGRLPGWTHWWPEAEVAALFPDAAARAAVEAEQQRLPLAYFDEAVPAPVGWRHVPAAYLAFGDTYDQERAQAEAAGWPVTRLEGRHLHQLVDPVGVVAALEGLMGRMGLRMP